MSRQRSDGRTASASRWGWLLLAVVAGAVVMVGIAALRPAGPGAAAAPSTPAGSLSGLAGTPFSSATTAVATQSAHATATARSETATCTPTDQDRYVYHPYRLQVRAACIRVTGVVQAVRHEADGDLHILLRLDPAFGSLLTPANQGMELGDLVVEPVCGEAVTQADAIAVCASDPDPLRPPFPAVGDQVWMEGRYVLDLDHDGWAELHPLYRWGRR